MLKELKYIFLFSKDSYSTKKKVYAQILNHVVFLFFNFLLYRNLYNLKPELAEKMPLSNAIWSMAMYFIIFWLGTRRLSRLFKEDIESGNIEMYLLRPMSYVKQKVLQITGQNIYPFLLAIITSCILSYVLVGLPVVEGSGVEFVVQLVVLFIFSQILMYLLYVFCGLTAFWLNDNTPIEMVFGKLIMILGGAWVPVAFFPELIQKISYFSPFGVSASIALAMYPDATSNFTRNMIVIIIWSLVFMCLNYFLNKKALKKLAVNG